ncbi:MAG: HDOD domain-containing protein [Candidatus Sumerlaeia bacterium]
MTTPPDMKAPPRKKRILFVDDEPRILEGIQRMVRSMRKQWDFEFARGGSEALGLLMREDFDVIVTDIKMPLIDGAELLNSVKKLYPSVVRVVLSGHADKDMILKLSGCVHQYLSKPTNPDKLKTVLARACQMSNLLGTEKLRSVVTQIDSLPSLPSTHMELMQELDKPEADSHKVQKIVSSDMAMSSKLLQLVNSSFFGLGRKVTSPSMAVSLLGLETLKSLAFAMHLFSQFEPAEDGGFSARDLWDHSAIVAVYAKRVALAHQCPDEMVEESFISGMLHDIGQLALVTAMPDVYGMVVKISKEKNIQLSLLEQHQLGATHAEVGAYLLGLWGLPESLAEVVLFHHHPGNSHKTAFLPMTAVHIADAIAHRLDAEKRKVKCRDRLDLPYIKSVGISARQEEWETICRKPFQQEEEAIRG